MPSDLLAARGRDRLPMPAAGDFAADHRAGVAHQRKHELECRQQELLEQISERNTPAQRILMRASPRIGVAAPITRRCVALRLKRIWRSSRCTRSSGGVRRMQRRKPRPAGPVPRAFPCELELSSIPIAAPSMTRWQGSRSVPGSTCGRSPSLPDLFAIHAVV